MPDLLQQTQDPIHQVSADGAYDTFGCHGAITERGANVVILPKENVRITQHGNRNGPPLSHDEVLRSIRDNRMKVWKQDSNMYGISFQDILSSKKSQLITKFDFNFSNNFLV